MPSTCVKTNVISASASVTESVDVAAKSASVGTWTPAIVTFSSESGNGMNPSMLTTQMKTIRRRDVREPAADRLRRQALLGDLHLRDLVDELAERLSLRRLAPDLDPHEDDPDHAREERAEQQVRDGLVDRQVERPEVDRDPLMQRPLRSGVELLVVARLVGRERDGGQHEVQDPGEADEAPRHARASCPKYSTSDTASSTENASA